MTRRPPTPGEIKADALYTYSELSARLRLGQAGLRKMQRAGLRTALFGRRRYILGRHVIEFFERLEGEQ